MTVVLQPNINIAQTFFFDKEIAGGASVVSISAVDLYFKLKPDPFNNKSGISEPGVEIFIAETVDSVPRVYTNYYYARARLEYSDIASSSDASLASRFRFENPITIQTDKEYALIVKYDGNEDFIPWISRQGDVLINSTTTSPGSSGRFAGKYFEFTPADNQVIQSSTQTATTDTISTDNNAPGREINGSWRALNDTDLKFSIFICRYFVQGVPVQLSSYANNTNYNIITNPYYTIEYPNGSVPEYNINIPFKNYEYAIFDEGKSLIESNVALGGSRVYQNTVFWPGGWANGASSLSISVTANSNVVTANSNYPNGATFSWNDVFDQQSDPEYIVIISENDGGIRKTDIRRVTEIVSNTILHVDAPTSITNTAANFIVSPIAKIAAVDKTRSFGQTENLLILEDSNGNSSIRFVNNVVQSANIVAGGSGYSNGDILYVIGFEDVSTSQEGGYKAVANLVTNSSGGITAVYFSNVGAGFNISEDIVAVYSNSTSNNSTANTSAGSSANIQFVIETTLRGELQKDNGYFKSVRFVNLPSSIVIPRIKVSNPIGVSHQTYHQSTFDLFNSNNATSSNAYYLAANSAANNRIQVQSFSSNYLTEYDPAVLPSYSNQWIINFSNGTFFTPIVPALINSNNALAFLSVSSNNDFSAAIIDSNPSLMYCQYVINNDYTNEHTDRGNAFSKHVTTKFNFANNRSAEDLLIYLTAYKPQYTDIQVYARLYNATDVQDEFDDKNWTRLEMFGANTLSSSHDLADAFEFAYQIPAYPNSSFTFAGYATTTSNSTTITGVNTTFNDATSNIVANDLVKIYSPLFPNNYMITVVNTVTNATHFTVTDPVVNNNVIGAGMKVDKIAYKHQAFRNQLNDNVVRYYSSSMAPFDSYDTIALKIVMLSESSSIVPRIDNMFGVGATA